MKDRELEEIKEIYATMQRVDFIEKLTNVAEGLKGEVERLSFERDNALSLRDVAVKHHANLIQQVETYRKALERLDAYIDFSEPLDDGDWGIENVSGINGLFSEIKGLLGDLS